MAEKLDLAVKVTTDASSLDVLTGKLNKAREAAKEMAAKFGEGSKEAQQAAAEVGRLETQITKTKSSASALSKPVEALNAELKNAGANLDAVNAKFGKGSAEAKEAAKEVSLIQAELSKVKEAGSGVDEPIKSMKAQLKEANNELLQTIDRFGELSPEAANAATKVAGLKDKIGDAKTLTDAFNPDAKFKGLGNAIQGAAGAFTALQGAQALFGTESKAVQETLLKVQGAMAFSQGINSALESVDAFKALGAQLLSLFVVKKADTAATQTQIVAQEGLATAQVATAGASKVLKAALVSTGIGALVVGVGILIGYMMTWGDSTKEQEEAQKKLNDQIDKQNKLLALSLEEIDYSTKARVLRAKSANKSEEEITKIEKEGTEQRLEELKGARDKAQEITDKAAKNDKIKAEDYEKLKENEAKATKAYSDAIDQYDLASLQSQVDVNDKKNKNAEDFAAKQKSIKDKNTEENKQLRESQLEFDKETADLIAQNKIDAIKDEFEKRRAEIVKEDKKDTDNLKNLLETKKITQDEYDKRKEAKAIALSAKLAVINEDEAAANLEKANKFAEQQAETANQVEQNRINAITDATEKRNAILDDAEQKDLAKLVADLDKKIITEEQYAQKKLAQDEKYRLIRQANNQTDAKKELDDKIKYLDEEIKAGNNNFDAQRAALQKKDDINKEALAKGLIDKEEYNKRYKELSDQEDAIDMAQLEFKQKKAQEIFKIFQGAAELFKSILDAASDKINRQQTKDAKIQKELLDSKKITNEQYQKNIAKINEDAEKKQNKIQRKQILADKAMAVAGIVMNTLQANAKSVAQFPETLGQPWVTYNTISGVLGVATTIAAAVKALSALGGGGGGDSNGGADASAIGTSSGGGGAAPIAPVASTTALPQDQINQLSTANSATRAYVIESDVTNSQDRITRINRAARIN